MCNAGICAEEITGSGKKWGFCFSVDKTLILCSKMLVNPKVQITLYGQPVKQVLSIMSVDGP